MKAYILVDKDFDLLLTKIDRDPMHGQDGGSSRGEMDARERQIWKEVHRFYNYQVRTWIDEVQK